MSDVIWAALVAGGVALAGNVVTYRLAVSHQKEEFRRQDAERNERRRGNQQSVYVQLSFMLNRLAKYAHNYSPSKEDWQGWLDYYAYWSGLVLIVGSEPIIQAVTSFNALLDSIGPDLARAAERDHWQAAFKEHADKIESARKAVTKALRDDAIEGLSVQIEGVAPAWSS